MEIIHNLLTHSSLLLILLLSATIVYYCTINFSQGLINVHSLSFEAIKNAILTLDLVDYLFMIASVGIPASCLTIVSWIGSEAIYTLNDRFNSLDIFSISACFFFCVFSLMASSTFCLVYSNGKDGEYYYPFSLGGLNLSFTPAIIITSFVTIGMFFTYCHHN